MEKQLIHVLRRLSIYSSPIQEKRLVDEVLYDSKRERENLSKSEIEEKGLNIYDKRGFRITDLIKSAVLAGYVSEGMKDNGLNLLITPEGSEELLNWYSNNRSREFIQFREKVSEIMKENNEPTLQLLHVAAMFFKGLSAQQGCQFYLKENRYRDETETYHRHIIKLMGQDSNEDLIAFNFIPKLFVPVELINEKVELEIVGIDVPSEMMMTKPYPNQRYTVAGLKLGKEKSASGFYPIIGKKEDFPSRIEVTLKWKIGMVLNVTHRLFISFDFSEGIGNLFSTEQYLTRSNNLKGFNLTTYTDYDNDLWRDREVAFDFDLKTRTLTIEEPAKLNLLPMYLHSVFHGDRYFQKWTENTRNLNLKVQS